MQESTAAKFEKDPPLKRGVGSRLFSAWMVVPLAMLVFIIGAPLAYRNSQLLQVTEIGDPFDVAAFCNVDVPDDQNAFINYRQAAGMLTREPAVDVNDDEQRPKSIWLAAPPQLKQWVVDNQTALETWRKGTEKPKALYLNPREYTINTLLPEIQTMRSISRLAGLQASRLEHEGDFDGAWRMHLAKYRCSRHVGWHGCAIERLVGIAMHDMAAQSILLWAENPSINEDMLRKALGEIRANYGSTESLSNSIKVEYIAMQNTLDLPIDDVIALVKQDSRGGTYDRLEFFLRSEPDLGRRIIRHWFADLLEQNSSPADAASIPKHLARMELTPLTLKSPVAKGLIPATDQLVEAVRMEQARQGALEILLAAQIHFRKHGSFPIDATELIQDGLPSIPADPFLLTGVPMKYRLDSATNSISAWSVGKNGTDDGGNLKTIRANSSSDIGMESFAPSPLPER